MQNTTARIAFAAFLCNIGIFAARAHPDNRQAPVAPGQPRREPPDEASAPHNHDNYAAHAALAWHHISAHLPEAIQRHFHPFTAPHQANDSRDAGHDTATLHHDSETLLQRIIATADRIASGLAHENNPDTPQPTHPDHARARLHTLFTRIRLHTAQTSDDSRYRYPLAALSARSIFPKEGVEPANNADVQQEYKILWDSFLNDLSAIPASHSGNGSLWLDHFDTLWQHYAHAIPAATDNSKPDVSLYDHSKTTAALTTALWYWHESTGKTDADAMIALKNRDDWNEEKILLIQGDFFGIQNFIFAGGSDTNRKAAKILRGRSFQVSLFAELAALKVLQACNLPPTSQIINAAGKFLIVAPNTTAVTKAVKTVRQEINDWFIQHSYGQVALGLATQAASCNDFIDKTRFKNLISQSFAVLEAAKLQRFDLTRNAPVILKADYPHGVCKYNQTLPAQTNGEAQLSADQIAIGEQLTRRERLLILGTHALHNARNTRPLQLPVFGYTIAFTADEDISGEFAAAAQQGTLLRCWDFSLPTLQQDKLWHGYARRHINAYTPYFAANDLQDPDKYRPAQDKDDNIVRLSLPKTFNHLACEERHLDTDGHYIGNIAIATLKGDVDNLGKIFETGLAAPTFAKMAALSRQMNHFFSLWLPAWCAAHYPNTYTVFAGGDDFFMIGPWLQTQRLAADMHTHFTAYVADNHDITFSAGIAINKPGLPLPHLSANAENALERSKARPGKNAVSLYGETVSWHKWQDLDRLSHHIDHLRHKYRLSTGILYAMLQYCDMAQREKSGNIEASMWHSHLFYRTRRYADSLRHLDAAQRISACHELQQYFHENIRDNADKDGNPFRIPLFNHFYQRRVK